jgi:hypothetical protein
LFFGQLIAYYFVFFCIADSQVLSRLNHFEGRLRHAKARPPAPSVYEPVASGYEYAARILAMLRRECRGKAKASIFYKSLYIIEWM